VKYRIQHFSEMKQKGEKFVMVTAYDYSTARIVDEVGIPLILVGDSLAGVVLGYESTLPVTMDVMLHHTRAVTRGAKNALVVGDMPFMTYQVSLEDAMRNAGRFMQEAGAGAVKLEGGVTVAEKVRRIVEIGIPVMGHIGLTPQSINQLGGHKIQGKTVGAAKKLLEDAIALEQAGAFAVVLETVPAPLAAFITQKVTIPTIGIGAGPGCDGQVQVINDILGSTSGFTPKHAKQFAQIGEITKNALNAYQNEVKAGTFPTEKESFPLDESVLTELKQYYS
jgi:3-methyl-2-oxobutanoate hydroxymethyltransferase